jgi:phosphoglycerate kinase
MDRLTIDDLELTGKRVLMRVDFNVPIQNGAVSNDTRIRAALPSIEKVLQEGGKLILMSHLGRPKGQRLPEFSLKPVADRLSELLKKEVRFAPDCVGEEVEKMVADLKDGDVLLLENTRFHKEETANDPEFSKQLAALGDVYVNDAFGSVHRAHASTAGVTKFIKECAAGYLLKKEIENLSRLLEGFERPFVVALGGAKVSGKIEVIHNLITRVNAMLIGGGMSYTFLKARKIPVGDSLLEEDRVATAYNLLQVASFHHPRKPVEVLLPTDHVIARTQNEAEYKVHSEQSIPAGWKGVDIGPRTIEAFRQMILKSKTVFWNGPMGVFENPSFANGTVEVAKAVAEATRHGAFTVVGGGDSIAALEKAGLSDAVSHVSTGGGASLEFLAGKDLPGIVALSKAKKKE